MIKWLIGNIATKFGKKKIPYTMNSSLAIADTGFSTTVQNSTTNKRSIYKIQQKVQQAEKACFYHVRKSPKRIIAIR